MADTNLASGTYTISLNKISGSHTSGKVLWCDLFNGYTKVGNPWIRDDQTSKTFTINDSVNIIKLGFDPNDTFNNFTFNIQIEQGSTATEYQPYQSKDYEINLHGKNLLPNSESLSNTGQYQDVIRFTDLEPSTKYTLKVKGTAGDKFYTGGSMPHSSLTIPSNGILEFTFTTNSTISDVAIIKNTTATNTLPLTECTLCKGSTAIEYEEFYNYKLCKIGDYKDKIDKSTGKNLFDTTKYTSTANVTILDNNNGVLELKGVSGYYEGVSQTFDVIPNQSYVLSYNAQLIDTSIASANYVRIREKDDTTVIATNYNSGNQTISFTPTTDEINVFFRVNGETNKGHSKYSNIQLEKGSATDYEPYGEQWYIKKNIGKVVLDGSDDEGWSYRAFPDNSYLSVKRTMQIGANGGYCDKFISNNNYDIVKEHMTISKQWKELCFAILKSRLAIGDVAGFKSWLSTNTPTAYYVLANPTYEIITNETLINQLEELTKLDTYNNYSAVTTTGDLINPELECVLFSQPAYQK